jgi:hypothetical protein
METNRKRTPFMETNWKRNLKPRHAMETKSSILVSIIAALLVILLPLSCEQLARPLPSPHPTHWRIAGTR